MQPLPSNLDTRAESFQRNRADMLEQLGVISALLEEVAAGGGAEAMARLRKQGKLPLRERDPLARLARICELRQAGLPLRTIRRVLEAQTPLAEVLEEQISVLNRRVSQLRVQQRVVLSLLELTARQPKRTLSRETWTDMFRAIGMSDEEMRQWHANFEKNMPEAHADFLHSLGLDGEEIGRIRAWSLA